MQKPSQTAQELKSNLLLNIILNLNYCTTKKHKIHGYRWPSLLPQMAFLTLSNHQGTLQGLQGQWMALIRMRVVLDCCQHNDCFDLQCPVDWICFCHLPKIQHCCLCPNGGYDLSLATHPPTPTTHLSHIMYHLWY